MTDPTFTPEEDRELLVVYPTQSEADRARRALLDAGVPDGDIHIGRQSDLVTALRAEMHEEVTNSWVVPNAGVAYSKESARGLSIFSLALGALGLLIAFPLALWDFGSSYWVRFAIIAAVAVTAGRTISLVAGPASTSERPTRQPGAAKGIVLRVDQDTPELRRLLSDLNPIRLDEVAHDDQPIDTVTTEGPSSVGETVTEAGKDIAANARGDDYHEQR